MLTVWFTTLKLKITPQTERQPCWPDPLMEKADTRVWPARLREREVIAKPHLKTGWILEKFAECNANILHLRQVCRVVQKKYN